MKWFALAAALSASAAHADGGIVRGSVKVDRAQGLQPGPVLVYIVGFQEKPSAQAPVVKQVGKKFIPDLVAVTAGGTIKFPNGDPFLHNVFSQTTARNFDLGSYPQGQTRSRTFPRTGVIDVFCNIHPEMSATVVVLPNTRFVMADAEGKFEIKDVPAGTWSVFAYSRRASEPAKLDVTVTSGGASEIEIPLHEVQREFKHKNKYGETYRDTTIYAPGS